MNLLKKQMKIFKIMEIESKIPSISGLATGSALTAVENKIPDPSSLTKETDYNTKINKIEKKTTDLDHDKYITASELNKLTGESSAARLENLIRNTDFDNKLISLNKKISSNKRKHLIVGNDFKKLLPFDSSLFIGKINGDGA